MVYMAEVLWILISGLTYRCHHSFGRHGILDAVSLYDNCPRVLDMQVFSQKEKYTCIIHRAEAA